MSKPGSRYDTLFGCATGVGGRAVVLGVPYDRGTHPLHAGAAGAPATLRRLSAPTHCRADRHGIYDHARKERVLAAEAFSDLGDVRFRVRRPDAEYLDQIADATRVLAQEGRKPVLLGGDHLITLPSLRGIAKAIGPVQMVQVDAHHDYERLEEGEVPMHASFVSHLVREGLVARVVQVGIRGYDWGEAPAPEGVVGARPEDVGRALLPGVPVYVSIDTYAFDPTVAGAVNFPEPEGLTLTDLDMVLAQARMAGSLIGADWTEYNPNLDTKNSLTGLFILRGLIRVLRALVA